MNVLELVRPDLRGFGGYLSARKQNSGGAIWLNANEAAQPQADLLPGACIQLGSFNSIDWRDEDDMARWYAQWRLPSLKTLPCAQVGVGRWLGQARLLLRIHLAGGAQ